MTTGPKGVYRYNFITGMDNHGGPDRDVFQTENKTFAPPHCDDILSQTDFIYHSNHVIFR